MTTFQWADTLRDLARHCGHTAADVLEGQTFGRFFAVWCRAPNTTDGLDLAALNAKIRRRRRELGLDKPRRG